jgi:hypothetical protein
LKVVDGITIWSEGVGGDFALELYEVSAVAQAHGREPMPVSCM